jgi:hypothetical protein
MHVNGLTLVRTLMLVGVIGLLAACSSGASYAARMTYLRSMAQEGVQTHRLLVAQGAITTGTRCTAADKGLQDQNPPDDTGTGVPSPQWLDQIQAFFVQSCVTGLPKAVPGHSVGSRSGASPSPSSPSVVSSPTQTH